MAQTQAVWLLIGLAILTAGLPFWLQRTLVCLPWSREVLPGRPAWQRLLVSLAHLVLLFAWGWAAMAWIGHSLAASGTVVLGRVLVMLAVLGLLMWWPGRQWHAHQPKPFISRLVEVFALYLLVGVVGFSLETQLGNPFPQAWEFYAITLCLYVVLAFPGFVYRYLLRQKRVG